MIFPSSIFRRFVWLVLVSIIFSWSCAAEGLWVTAYYPAAAQQIMPVSEIDFSVVTHVVQFALAPNTDGSLNDAAVTTNPATSADLVQHAHAAGRKALICVGGADSGIGFRGASAPSHRAALIANLIGSMNAGNYDGIDLDWEPLPAADFQKFTNLVLELRAAMDLLPTHKLLTAAVSAYPTYGDPPDSECKMLAALQSCFEQINIMTYDLSGPYAGWVTWFNSPIYDAGWFFPSTTRLLPSLDGSVKNFIANGVDPAKLGVGVAFYGDVWVGGTGASTGGVSQPRELWRSPAYRHAIAVFGNHGDLLQARILSLGRQGAGRLFEPEEAGRAERGVCQLRRRTHLPREDWLRAPKRSWRNYNLAVGAGASTQFSRRPARSADQRHRTSHCIAKVTAGLPLQRNGENSRKGSLF